jgi:hypothetical protein
VVMSPSSSTRESRLRRSTRGRTRCPILPPPM